MREEAIREWRGRGVGGNKGLERSGERGRDTGAMVEASQQGERG